MKHSAWILIAAVLLVSGCRENYVAEKEFYRASALLSETKSQKTPEARSSHIEKAIDSFERIAEEYPKSPKAIESLFIAAHLKAKLKRFDEARSLLWEIVATHEHRDKRAAEARFKIARYYELEGKWAEAETEYWDTSEYYPLEPKGLYAPIHVISHYKALGETENAKEAYGKAVRHYIRTLNAVNAIHASCPVRHFLALTHLTHQEWEKAVNEWLTIIEQFPRSPYAPAAIMAAAEAVSLQGKSQESARLYKKLLADYAGHPLAGQAATSVGLLLLNENDFKGAREHLSYALAIAGRDQDRAAEIKFYIARTYEQEGRWTEADRLYGQIEQVHPVSPAALKIPLIRASRWEKLGERKAAQESVEKAIEKYKELSVRLAGTTAGRAAEKSLFEAYKKTGDWQALLASIDGKILKEKAAERKAEWLLLKALITANRVKDAAAADKLFRQFLADYPAHPMAPVAKSRLQAAAGAGT